MLIRNAANKDTIFCNSIDPHITSTQLTTKIQHGEILLAVKETEPIGYLRYNYFWDEIPFMNLLIVLEEYRGQNIGTQLVEFWETTMKQRGYDQVLTSTQENENAQNFYRKLGYHDIGTLLIKPDEAPELFLTKNL